METIGRSDFMLPTLLQTLMAGTDLVASSPLADHSELNASQQLLTGGSQVLQGGEGLHCQVRKPKLMHWCLPARVAGILLAFNTGAASGPVP